MAFSHLHPAHVIRDPSPLDWRPGNLSYPLRSLHAPHSPGNYSFLCGVYRVYKPPSIHGTPPFEALHSDFLAMSPISDIFPLPPAACLSLLLGRASPTSPSELRVPSQTDPKDNKHPLEASASSSSFGFLFTWSTTSFPAKCSYSVSTTSLGLSRTSNT